MISLQTAPQIRLVQNNNTVMAEKIQTTIVNTIPLWKSQMVLALGIAHSTQAAQAQRQVSDVTNAELIQTLDDVMRIQKEGRAKRQAAEAEMARMENDLKAKLLEIQR